jgi:hypothetical protein
MADGIGPTNCLSAPRPNHLAVALVITTKAFSSPGSRDSWPALVGAQKSDVVHVRRGHVDDTGCQERQRRRQETGTDKDK